LFDNYWLPVDTDEVVRQLHKEGLFDDGLEETSLRIVGEQTVVLVQTPAVNIAIIVYGETAVISGVNLHDVVQFLNPRWNILGCKIQSSMAKLCLLIGSPGVHFALGVQSENMGSTADDLGDAGGDPKVYLTDIQRLLVKVLICQLFVCSKPCLVFLWVALENLATQGVSHGAPTEETAICGQQEGVEGCEGHLGHETLGRVSLSPVDILKTVANLSHLSHWKAHIVVA
jgi:hypothetical protein